MLGGRGASYQALGPRHFRSGWEIYLLRLGAVAWADSSLSAAATAHVLLWHGGTMVSTAASQRQGPGFDSLLGSLSAWSLHILPVSAWVSFGCSGFLPQSKDARVRLIRHAKLSLSVRRIWKANIWGYGEWPPSAL